MHRIRIIFQGVNIQVISLTSKIMTIISIEIEERRKCDREAQNMCEYVEVNK